MSLRSGPVAVDYGRLVVEQLEFYWNVHLRPRLAGLTDDEFFWEPVPGSWSVRRTAEGACRQDGAWPDSTTRHNDRLADRPHRTDHGDADQHVLLLRGGR